MERVKKNKQKKRFNIQSWQALRVMAAGNNGMVTCPRTKEVFSLKDAEKVYVM